MAFVEPDPYYFIEDTSAVPKFLVNADENNRLTPFRVIPGRTYYYELPEVNEPDRIEFALGHDATGSQLSECTTPCY